MIKEFEALKEYIYARKEETYSILSDPMAEVFNKDYYSGQGEAYLDCLEKMKELEGHKVLTTWHNPEVDHPEPGMSVVVSFSAKGKYASFDHAIGIGVFLEDDGWDIDTCCKAVFDKTTLKIHGWNDLDTLGVDFE